MPLRSTRDDWGVVAKVLHWTMAAGILTAIACGIAMAWFLDGNISLKFKVYQFHKSLGFVMLCIALVRLVWRLTAQETPPLPPDMKPHERWIAEIVHISLYGCLIVQPLLGWAGASASPLNIPTVVFGWVTLPRLLPANATLETILNQVHSVVGWSMTGAIALHLAGSLHHHFILRDDTLRRMLPSVRSFLKGAKS